MYDLAAQSSVTGRGLLKGPSGHNALNQTNKVDIGVHLPKQKAGKLSGNGQSTLALFFLFF